MFGRRGARGKPAVLRPLHHVHVRRLLLHAVARAVRLAHLLRDLAREYRMGCLVVVVFVVVCELLLCWLGSVSAPLFWIVCS